MTENLWCAILGHRLRPLRGTLSGPFHHWDRCTRCGFTVIARMDAAGNRR
jgi:hypothetical protein